MTTPYKIGQILYVVLAQKSQVYPMQCVEVITKRTLEGEVITYMIRGGASSDGGATTIAVTDIDGEIFDSSEHAKKMLIERATNSINKLVDTAVAKSKEWYPSGFESSNDDPLVNMRKSPSKSKKPSQQNVDVQKPQAIQNLDEAEYDVVELPDGQFAKVRSISLPDALR
jgi:hypothetical protein